MLALELAAYADLHKGDAEMTWTRFVAALLTSLLIATGTLESRAADTSPADKPAGAGATAAAAVSDVFYVPGKAVVCGVSGVLWVATMALTLGTLYDEAADFVKGGCGGRWVLTGDDIKPAKSY
jgi:hypothetical protein